MRISESGIASEGKQIFVLCYPEICAIMQNKKESNNRNCKMSENSE
jgi:hypothetical protein